MPQPAPTLYFTVCGILNQRCAVTAECNLEGGGTWLRIEGAIHPEVSERIGIGKFYKTGTLEISYNLVIKF